MAAFDIHELVRLLAGANARDTSSIAAVLEQLRPGVSEGNPAQKRMVAEAMTALEALVSGTCADPEATWIAGQRFLQAAAAVGGPVEKVAAPSPPSEPKREAPEAIPPSAPLFVFDEADRELVVEFVTEALDYVAQAEGAMLVLESNPADMDAVDTVFRAFHTVKGVSAMLGLTPISNLAHKAESLLTKVRSRDLRFSGEVADLALASVDSIKALVEGVNALLTGETWSPPSNLEKLADALLRVTEVDANADAPKIDVAPLPPPRIDPIPFDASPAPPPSTSSGPRSRRVRATLKPSERPVSRRAPKGATRPPVAQAPAAPTPVIAEPARDAVEAERSPGEGKAAPRAAAGARNDNDSASVRIRTERLDRLVDMVGELVIAHSMVRQDPTLARSELMDLTRKVAHAGKIVRELQELAMSLRMVPLKPTFQKLARVVRDTAQKSGKAVELVVAGEETEIDRNMVDVIADPLVHMLRNAVDHGIESPEERVAKGKPRTGTIRLTASHSGGNVVVELCDDGAGLDRTRIVKKAVERGLIESDAQMTDSDVYNLIFEPGFSTRDQVTDVSGRGVGMDVVRRNVQTLNGRVDISSVLGAGTTFSLRLPLTLAVTDGMLVRVGEERFIVPTVNIQTSLRPKAEHISTVSARGELLVIRGELIPMFRLHRLFELGGAVEDPTQALAVVVNGVEGRCALLVDELLGQQQVVAKSLGDGLGNVRGIAGGAILGDGRVGLILDTPEIIALAREGASERDQHLSMN